MRRRGIALISVLMLAAAILAILAAGLQLGASGVLHVSQAHKRNVALCAAEAGVYEAVLRLENDKGFTGTAAGDLVASGGKFSISVTNDLWTGAEATVVSTGTYAGVSRTLKVSLQPDTEGFGALSLGGKVYTYDKAYINGISSAKNPLYRPGNGHSEFGGATDDGFVGQDFNGDGEQARIRATGDLSAAGRFASDLEVVARSKKEMVHEPQYRLNKDEMLAVSFSAGTVPTDGKFTGSARFNGDVTFPMKVTIAEGATIHIQGGSAKFLGGLEGKGSLVVDGDIVIQTDAEFDSSNDSGLKVLADGSIAISHPEASSDDEGVHYEIDAVGDYFAQMPPDAPSQIAQGVPVNAPRDGDFFLWIDDQLSGTPSPEFNQWYEGDGSEMNPGLSPSTKQWLGQSRGIKEDIKAWADSANG